MSHKPNPHDRSPDPAQRSTSASGERLQKFLAAAGVGSRRQCETLISEGRVEVDGRVVTQLGSKVDPQRQQVRVDGEVVERRRPVYLMLHKPPGVVSTNWDPEGRARTIDLIPPEAGRLFGVGRLDKSSEGLMLLTNDGPLAQRLTHPRHGVPKTYSVEVAGQPEVSVLKELKQGVHLAEGVARVHDVRVRSRRKQSTLLEIVLDEGRNREIRRLLARVGHKVLRLVRIAIGPLRLGELPLGAYRPLERREVEKLREAASGAKKKSSPRPPRKARKIAGSVGGRPKSAGKGKNPHRGPKTQKRSRTSKGRRR